MVPLAPRYDIRLIEAVIELDDPTEPIAETCRRVGAKAWELGLVRPTYPHLYRLVRAKREYETEERERRAELRAIAGEVATSLLVGRFVDPYDVADRVQRVQAG